MLTTVLQPETVAEGTTKTGNIEDSAISKPDENVAADQPKQMKMNTGKNWFRNILYKLNNMIK